MPLPAIGLQSGVDIQFRVQVLGVFLPLVSREWKNGSNGSYNCTPFLHSLLTKGKKFEPLSLRFFGESKSLGFLYGSKYLGL